MDERELVGLLYRADWTRLALTGTVRGHDHEDSLAMIFEAVRHGARLGALGPEWAFPSEAGGFSPAPFSGEMTVTVAPGGRYRQATANGSRIRGHDGERAWEWLGELPPNVTVKVHEAPSPLAVLLAPSWLLSGHRLTVEDGEVACGRYGIRVVAEPMGGRRWPGARFADMARALAAPFFGSYRRSTVVVDAELGILLRCSGEVSDDEVEVTEFTELTVGVDAPPEEFAAPSGSTLSGADGLGPADFARTAMGPLGGFGWEAAKVAGGLAAGGLGLAVRLTPARRPDPFAQATVEGDDPAMPSGDTLPEAVLAWAAGDDAAAGAPGPADLPPVSDAALHLLYRGGLAPAPFAGSLHEWADGDAILAAVPESARRTGFGGVGFLIDSLRDKTEAAGSVTHLRHDVRFGGPDGYRVDTANLEPEHERGRGPQRLTVACDRERCWEVYPDRVETSRAGEWLQLPEAVASMADGSWLLGCRLFDGSPAEVAGRAGWRVIVVGHTGRLAKPGLLAAFGGDWLPAVAVVDAETGRLLRLTRYLGGRVARVLELRSVGPAGEDGYGFMPPEGLPVAEKPARVFPPEGMVYDEEFDGYVHRHAPAWLARESVLRQASLAGEAARRFFGSFLGGR